MMKCTKEERAKWNPATEYDCLKAAYADFIEEADMVPEAPENAVQETAEVVIAATRDTSKEAEGNQEASGSVA